MFDLFEMKVRIKADMKNLGKYEEFEQEDEEKNFVSEVVRMHAALTKME